MRHRSEADDYTWSLITIYVMEDFSRKLLYQGTGHITIGTEPSRMPEALGTLTSGQVFYLDPPVEGQYQRDDDNDLDGMYFSLLCGRPFINREEVHVDALIEVGGLMGQREKTFLRKKFEEIGFKPKGGPIPVSIHAYWGKVDEEEEKE